VVTGEKASGWAGSAEDEESPEEPDGLETELSPQAARFSNRRAARAKEISFFMG